MLTKKEIKNREDFYFFNSENTTLFDKFERLLKYFVNSKQRKDFPEQYISVQIAIWSVFLFTHFFTRFTYKMNKLMENFLNKTIDDFLNEDPQFRLQSKN